MKKHAYNFEVITQETVNKAYAAEFGATKVSTLTYDLGAGITESYTQLHLPAGLTAILHDDTAQIVVKVGHLTLGTLAWTSATVNLLRNLGALPAGEAFAIFASQAVAK